MKRVQRIVRKSLEIAQREGGRERKRSETAIEIDSEKEGKRER